MPIGIPEDRPMNNNNGDDANQEEIISLQDSMSDEKSKFDILGGLFPEEHVKSEIIG